MKCVGAVLTGLLPCSSIHSGGKELGVSLPIFQTA